MSTKVDLAVHDPDSARARLTTRRTFLKAAAAAGAVAAMYATPRIDSFGPKPAYATITGNVPCLQYIDFDTIGNLGKGDRIGTYVTNGSALSSGQQPWSGFGVKVETLKLDQSNFHPYAAMIFDSANPTGGDTDLRTPGGHSTNTVARRNILIVSEDGDSGDPDDDAGGGVIVLQFDTPREIHSVDMIDIDDGNTWRTRIRAYDVVADLTAPGFIYGEPAFVNRLKSVSVPDVGNNSWQNVPFAQTGVSELRIRFRSSGAISKINFVCPT